MAIPLANGDSLRWNPKIVKALYPEINRDDGRRVYFHELSITKEFLESVSKEISVA